MNHTHFPLFINSSNKDVVVFGGGNICFRRIKSLLKFNFTITVISPSINSDILALKANYNNLKIIYDVYKEEYIKNQYIVLASTNDRQTNHAIYVNAHEKNILVNVCDCKEECDFYFSGIIEKDDVVIGVCGSGENHKYTKKIIDTIKTIIRGL